VTIVHPETREVVVLEFCDGVVMVELLADEEMKELELDEEPTVKAVVDVLVVCDALVKLAVEYVEVLVREAVAFGIVRNAKYAPVPAMTTTTRITATTRILLMAWIFFLFIFCDNPSVDT
jgi:hypothetical protein